MGLMNLVRSPPLPPPTERRDPGPHFPLDLPLVRFSAQSADAWTLRDACEGTQIFGATGSGKTSGSGQMLAKAFLRAGFGGLVLCAKPSERKLWQRYCKETGRTRSLIVFDGSGARRFNFLNYELRRGERLVTHNLVSLFLRIMDAAKGQGAGGGSQENPFWRDSVSELLGNAFTALYAAHGRVVLAELMELIDSAPQDEKQVADEGWRAASFCFRTIRQVYEQPVNPLPDADGKAVAAYFLKRLPRLDPKTRSNIIGTLTSLAHPFLTGYLRELFCTTTNVVPEMTHEGAILVIDLSVKEHAEAGILAQHIIKYLWQRATERRADEGDHTRPVFLWADECQFFVSEYDMEFQSTARSARACTVYMTQSLPTYYTQIGGRHPEHAVHALLGNFQTKIFHQNTDEATNRLAAEIIGRAWQWTESFGASRGGGSSTSDSRQWGTNWGATYSSAPGGASSHGGSSGGSEGGGRSVSDSTQWGHSSTQSQTVEYELLPAAFTGLAKGGRGRQPEAIIVQGGRVWADTGRAWLHTAFRQG